MSVAVEEAPVSVPDAMTAPSNGVPRRRGRRAVTVESLVVVILGIFGFRLGARPINDNSMFTHLRTGVDMVRSGHIPRADQYSWSALGHPWVVQSWLAEWSYGVLQQLGGLRLVVLQQGVLAGLSAFLIARLARTGHFLRTIAAATLALGAGIALWSTRPLLFGLLAFAALVTVVEERRASWLLLPIGWLWVNTHGSFVLGVAWLGLVVVGEAIDRRTVPIDRIRQCAWFCAGLLGGAINPLGPKLLLFPLAVGEKAHVFQRVVEWRSPDFHQPLILGTLVCALAGAVLLLRQGSSRTPWRDVLPVACFLLLGFLAVRNFPLLAVVLAAPLGRALRPAPGSPGADREASTVAPIAVAGIAVLAIVFAATALVPAALRTDGYPEDAVTFVHDQGLFASPHRVAEEDFVGNYLELRYGTRVPVFIDDRVDMFPVAVSDDFHELKVAGAGTMDILDRRGIDVVLWQQKEPLVTVLLAHGGWREVHRSHGFVVLVRSVSRS